MNYKNKKNIYIGTSGWSYDWQNFYPEDLPKSKKFEFYCEQFPTAEVNYSFYRLPTEKQYKGWYEKTPDDFKMVMKLSRYITHIKRLKGIKEPLRNFLSGAKLLGDILGPILVQLPPNFHAEIDTLTYFIETAHELKKEFDLPKLQLAFEFRHHSWFQEGNFDNAVELLKKENHTVAFAHSKKYPYPKEEPITSDFAYFRFHGPEDLFASPYREEGLKPFAKKMERLRKDDIEVYAFFNNDFNGYAPDDAKLLYEMV